MSVGKQDLRQFNIVATLPGGLQAGSYTLSVSTGAASNPFTVTYGAVGPQGPAGPVGPAGPAGPVAPAAPAGPVAPVSPVAPAGPVGPVAPVAPVAPVILLCRGCGSILPRRGRLSASRCSLSIAQEGRCRFSGPFAVCPRRELSAAPARPRRNWSALRSPRSAGRAGARSAIGRRRRERAPGCRASTT